MLSLLWPRKAAVALELPRFHRDPDSGELNSDSSPQLTVNQALPVRGNAGRLHLASINLLLPWNNVEELLESCGSVVDIPVNR